MTQETKITEIHLSVTEYEWGKLTIELVCTEGDMLSKEVHSEIMTALKEVEDNWNMENDIGLIGQ